MNFADDSIWPDCLSPPEGVARGDRVDGTGFSGENSITMLTIQEFKKAEVLHHVTDKTLIRVKCCHYDGSLTSGKFQVSFSVNQQILAI